MGYQPHEATIALPPLNEGEIEQLTEALIAGERGDLILYEGRMLDSPGVLEAFARAGVEPTFSNVELNGRGPFEYAISRALEWRDLNAAQRCVMALWLLPQYDDPERSGRPGSGALGIDYPTSGDEIRQAASLTSAGVSAVQTAIRIQKRNPMLLPKMFRGEISISKAAREVGLARGIHSNTTGYVRQSAVDIKGREIPTYYGKGDKWKEAIGPLQRYLAGWEKRGYEFRHVNPKEARKRLALIEDLQAKLDVVKKDLEPRAHSATLTIRNQKG